MSEVFRFKMEFLPEGVLRECVYAADFDRVTAERDAAMGREAALKDDVQTLGCIVDSMGVERDALQLDLNQRDEQIATLDLQREAHLRNSQVAERRVGFLEQEVERRADNCSVYRQHLSDALTMAEKIRDASLGMQRKYLSDLIVHLYQNSGAALKPAERTNTSGKAHCPHDGICHTSNETCAQAMARVAQIEPAEGGGDEAVNEG